MADFTELTKKSNFSCIYLIIKRIPTIKIAGTLLKIIDLEINPHPSSLPHAA